MLLIQVERLESEKVALQQDIASLNTKLVNAKYDLSDLEDESVSGILIIVVNVDVGFSILVDTSETFNCFVYRISCEVTACWLFIYYNVNLRLSLSIN